MTFAGGDLGDNIRMSAGPGLGGDDGLGDKMAPMEPLKLDEAKDERLWK